MKAPLFVLAAAGALGLTLVVPNRAQAGQVFVDLHIGLPIVVHRPHVVYEPVVAYRPRVICPPPVVHDRPHHYSHLRGYYSAPVYPSYERGGYIAQVQIDKRLER
jgi:hypothetical protein